MRTINVRIYKFNELRATAQAKAIDWIINSWIEDPFNVHVDAIQDFNKLCEEADRLRTPWFLGQMVYEKCLDKVVDQCMTYEYYWDGEVYPNWMPSRGGSDDQ